MNDVLAQKHMIIAGGLSDLKEAEFKDRLSTMHRLSALRGINKNVANVWGVPMTQEKLMVAAVEAAVYWFIFAHFAMQGDFAVLTYSFLA